MKFSPQVVPMPTPAETNPSQQQPPDGADVKAQRDAYLQSLYALTRQGFTLTEDELRELQQSDLTLGEIIAQISLGNS
jgi:hypothetical protein